MIGVILTMLAIALFQVPVLLRQQQYRTLLGFSAMWLFATVFSLLVVLRVPLPVMLDILNFIYGRVFELLNLLKGKAAGY